MRVMNWGMIATVLVLAIGSVSHSGLAMAASSDQKQQAADAAVAKIGDPARYLADKRAQVAAAKEGKFGKLAPGDLRRLDDAERDIARLVSGRESLSDLDQEDRVTVYNAQETITSIASGKRHSRLVCKQRQLSGTRLKTTQCMTAEEDAARTREAREATRNAQRDMCRAGQEC